MTPERIVILAFIAIGLVVVWKLVVAHYEWKRDRLNPQPSKPKLPWADDPIAKSIAWTAATESGATFRTHALRRVSSSRVEFQPIFPRAWRIFMILMGIGVVVMDIVVSAQTKTPLITQIVVLSGFMGIGVFFWLVLSFKPVVFDTHLGMFWVGRKQPDQIVGHHSAKCLGRIADIYALQLIDTLVTTGLPGEPDSRTFSNLELNLVMKDGARLNAIKHGDSGHLRKDAEVLSAFLGTPLWGP